MWYWKNMPGWERALRLAGGAAMIVVGLYGAGLFGSASGAGGMSRFGWAMLAMGGGAALTGLAGWCPACALIGRKPVARP